MTAKEKRGAIIGGLIFVGIGIAMIVNPHAADGAVASGRNSMIEAIIVWIWGIPGGIVLALLGGATFWGGVKAVRNGSQEPEEQPEPEKTTETVPQISFSNKMDETPKDDKQYAPPGYFEQSN